MDNIIISNQVKYQKKLEILIKGGTKSLHVLADFDRTLTQAFSDGVYRGSLISVLYEEGYLSKEYQETAQGFFARYHPIEIDTTLSLKERKNAMEEWRIKHKQLLIKEGLTKQDIYSAMQSQNIQLRTGSKIFFDYLSIHYIPLIIISAGGLGTISIERYLQNQKSMYENIDLIGNDFVWDGDRAIDFRQPIIHSLNKDESTVQEFPEIYQKVKNRKNVILLGDSIGDTKMIEGFDYDVVLKIGFLNKDVDKYIDNYKKNFDIVVTNDGSMDVVNKILRKIK